MCVYISKLMLSTVTMYRQPAFNSESGSRKLPLAKRFQQDFEKVPYMYFLKLAIFDT